MRFIPNLRRECNFFRVFQVYNGGFVYLGPKCMPRMIKSFVLRAGRMSPRQASGFNSALPHFALSKQSSPWDLSKIFGREGEVWLEIGFGMGDSFLKTAMAYPDINFIGIEVHRAGLGSVAAMLLEKQIHNVRIAPFDAVEVFNDCLADATLSAVHIFFPDPWPKKRHHKRRLVQTEFISRLVKKIKPGGCLHCATDWEEYALQMLEVLSLDTNLRNRSPDGGFVARPETRPLTKFERRGLDLGHRVWDLIFDVL